MKNITIKTVVGLSICILYIYIYNRYIYKSKYYLDRDIIMRNNSILLDTLEYIVFKEKTHLKRGSGFTTVTQDLLKKKKSEKYQNLDLQKIIKNIVQCFLSLNNSNLS